jgi:hypothetical protein
VRALLPLKCKVQGRKGNPRQRQRGRILPVRAAASAASAMASLVGAPGAFGGYAGGDMASFLIGAHNNSGGNATGVAGTYLSDRFTTWYIPACALAGVLFSLYQVAHVSAVRVHSTTLDEEDTEALLGPAGDHDGALSPPVARARGSAAALAPAWRCARTQSAHCDAVCAHALACTRADIVRASSRDGSA